MMPVQVWVYGGAVLALLVCAWAYWYGGPVEKRGAAIIFIGWALSLLLQSQHSGPNAWIVGIDVGVALALVALSIQSRRIWTIFAAACQCDAVVSHFAANFTAFGIETFTYVTVLGLLGGHGLLVCLIAGVIGYSFERKRDRLSKAIACGNGGADRP